MWKGASKFLSYQRTLVVGRFGAPGESPQPTLALRFDILLDEGGGPEPLSFLVPMFVSESVKALDAKAVWLISALEKRMRPVDLELFSSPDAQDVTGFTKSNPCTYECEMYLRDDRRLCDQALSQCNGIATAGFATCLIPCTLLTGGLAIAVCVAACGVLEVAALSLCDTTFQQCRRDADREFRSCKRECSFDPSQ